MKGQLRLAIAVLAVAMRPASVAISASAFKGSFERTLKVNGPVDLDVTTGSGDIVVRTGDTATVRVKGTIQVQSDRGGTVGKAEERVRYLESHPPIRQDGNRIRVGPIEDRELSRNVSIDYELVVPAETRLSSQTGSGDQSIKGLRGRVNAKSGSGDIKLDSVQGSIQINTGSGDVSSQQTRAGGSLSRPVPATLLCACHRKGASTFPRAPAPATSPSTPCLLWRAESSTTKRAGRCVEVATRLMYGQGLATFASIKGRNSDSRICLDKQRGVPSRGG